MEHVAHHDDDTKIFGFWIYLMTDLIIFAVLFATFVVLRDSTFGGPTARELFHLPSAFAETLILLTSSFTCSLATLTLYRKQKRATIFWLSITFMLGLSFLAIEFYEFSTFIRAGAGPSRSAFLSSYFALVGTHGLHIAVGLLWILVAIVGICFRGLTPFEVSKTFRLALFWHFLDVVWIFIFSIVYGIGHIL